MSKEAAELVNAVAAYLIATDWGGVAMWLAAALAPALAGLAAIARWAWKMYRSVADIAVSVNAVAGKLVDTVKTVETVEERQADHAQSITLLRAKAEELSADADKLDERVRAIEVGR